MVMLRINRVNVKIQDSSTRLEVEVELLTDSGDLSEHSEQRHEFLILWMTCSTSLHAQSTANFKARFIALYNEFMRPSSLNVATTL